MPRHLFSVINGPIIGELRACRPALLSQLCSASLCQPGKPEGTLWVDQRQLLCQHTQWERPCQGCQGLKRGKKGKMRRFDFGGDDWSEWGKKWGKKKEARNRTTGGVKFDGEYAGYASQRDNIITFLFWGPHHTCVFICFKGPKLLQRHKFHTGSLWRLHWPSTILGQ